MRSAPFCSHTILAISAIGMNCARSAASHARAERRVTTQARSRAPSGAAPFPGA